MQINPFQIIHYPFDASLMSRVVCPPYDKLSDELIKACKGLHPHNFVSAIIGETLADHSYYPKAAETLRSWLRTGILEQESSPKLLVYRQAFECPISGKKLTRTGFFALLRLPERDRNDVLPHERTFAEHKADRLQLYRAVRGTPEAIFVLYSDPDQSVLSLLEYPADSVSFQDPQGHTNSLALLDSPPIINSIKERVESQKLLIADGHHRFETGMNFRDECRQAFPDREGPQPWDDILVYFTAMEDPGLAILPTHRIVKAVSDEAFSLFLERCRSVFEVEALPGIVNPDSIASLASSLSSSETHSESFGLVTRQKLYRLRLSDPQLLRKHLPEDIEEPLQDLPVVWLHRVLLDRFLGFESEENAPDRIAYVRTAPEVVQGLTADGYDLGILLRGTQSREVQKVAQAGLRMPQKSTDFFPKVLSGLAVYLHPM